MKTILLKKRIERLKESLKLNKKSLFYKLLKKTTILFFSFFLALAGTLTYIVGSQSSKDLEKIRTQENTLKSQAQSLKFSKTVQDVQELKELITKELQDSSLDLFYSNEFEKEMVLKNDGSIRSKSYENKAVGFISSHSNIDTQFQARFGKVFQILNTSGVTLKNNYFMVWAVFPNDSNIAYSKENPEANLKISHDFSDTSQDYWKLSTQELNPKQKGIWLKPYYDPSFEKWMISYISPVIVNNQHVLTLGLDISLKELFNSLSLTNEGKSYILSKNGEVIAHPDYMKEVISSKGKFNISAIESFNFSEMLKNDGMYFKNDNHYFVSSIDFTDWKYVSSYPEFKISSLIPLIIFWVCFLGFLGMILFATLYYVLNKYLMNPINQMSKSLSIDIVSLNPIKFKEEVLSEVNVIYNLYKKFISLLKEKEDYIENMKKLKETEINFKLKTETQKIKSTILKTTMSVLSPEVFRKVEKQRTLVDRIYAKVPVDLKKDIQSQYDEFNKSYKNLLSYEEQLNLYASPSDSLEKMMTFEEIFGKVEEIFETRFSIENIKYLVQLDKSIKMRVNEPLMLKALVAIFDYNFKNVINQKTGEKWIKIESKKVDQNFEINILSSSTNGVDANFQEGDIIHCSNLINSMDLIDISSFSEGALKGLKITVFAEDSSFLQFPQKLKAS